MAGEIRWLSADVQSRIRSGIALPSVTQCVEELVANALDAGATCIAVRVNLKTFKIQVVDNGVGIDDNQLQLLGERYATSKCHTSEDLDNLQYFGYRGEAIASIRDAAAVLEIISRAKGSSQTKCKMFHKGLALPVAEAAVARPSVGTTVTVHDLFYSLAVRRRGFNAGLEMERLCNRLQAIALMWPRVSLSLRNDENAQVLLQTKKCEDVLGVFASLFGETQAANLRPVTLDCGRFHMQGYMGREGHCRKDLQFLYINHRPVLNTKLHKAINSIFAKTSIFHRRSKNPLKHAAEASSSNSSPTKYGDKFPVFVLDVQCPLNEYDITFGPTKTLVEFRNWDPLLEAVEKMTSEFLRSEDLLIVTDKETGKNSSEVNKELTQPTRRKLEMEKQKEKGEDEKEEEEKEKEEQEKADGGGISEGGDSDWNELAERMIAARGKEYADKISTLDHPRGLFSLTVVRPGNKGERNGHSDSDSHPIPGETITDKEENHDKASGLSAEAHPALTADTTASTAARAAAAGSEEAAASLATGEPPAAEVPEKPTTSGDSFTAVRGKASRNEMLSVPNAENSVDFLRTEHRDVSSSVTFSKNESDEHLKPGTTESTICNSSAEVPSGDDPELPGPSSLSISHDRIHEVTAVSDEHLKRNDKEGLGAKTSVQASLYQQEKLSENQSEHLADEINKNQPSVSHFTNVKDIPRGHAGNHHRCEESMEESNTESQKTGQTQGRRTEENSLRPEASHTFCSRQDHTVEKWMHLTDVPVQQPSFSSTLGLLRRRPAPDNSTPEGPGSDAISRKLRKLQQQKEKSAIISSTLQQFRSSIGTRQHGIKPTQPETGGINCGGKADHDGTTSSVGCIGHSSSLGAFRRMDSSGVTSKHPACNQHCTAETASQNFLGKDDGNSDLDGPAGLTAATAATLSDLPQPRTTTTSLSNNTDILPTSHCNADTSGHTMPHCGGRPLEVIATATSGERRAEKRPLDAHPETGSKHMKPLGDGEKVHCLEAGREVPVATEVVRGSISGEPDPRPTSGKRQFLTSDLLVQTVKRKEVEQLHAPVVALISDTFIQPLSKNNADVTQASSRLRDADQFAVTTSRQEREMEVEHASPPPSDFCGTSPPRTPDIRQFDMTEILIQTPSRFLRKKAKETRQQHPITSSNSHVIHLMDRTTRKDRDSGVFKVPEVPMLKQRGGHGMGGKQTAAPAVEPAVDAADAPALNKFQSIASAAKHQREEDAQLTKPETSTFQSDPMSTTREEVAMEEMLSADAEHQTLGSTEPFVVSSMDEEAVLDSESIADKAVGEGSEDSDLTSLTGDLPLTSTPGPVCRATLGNSPQRMPACQLFDPEPPLLTAAIDTGRSVELPQPIMDPCVGEMVEEMDEAVLPTSAGKESGGSEMDVSDKNAAEEDQDSGPAGKETADAALPDVEDQSVEGQAVAEWIKMADPASGQEVYVNLATGHTSLSGDNVPSAVLASLHSQRVLADTAEADSINGAVDNTAGASTRSEVVAGLIEQHQAAATAVSCKWKDPEEAASCSKSDDSYIERLLTTWENPVFARPQETADESCKSAIPASKKARLPQQFNKNMLRNFKVVGQVDGKFLACLIEDDAAPRDLQPSPSLLVIIDQHAAHERIRLERDYIDVYEDKEKRIIKRSIVDPPHKLTLAEGDVRVLENFREEFHRIGIQFHRDLADRRVIYLETLPACTVSIEPNPLRDSSREPLAVDIVETIIKEYVQTLQSNHGAVGRMPLSLHEVLCNHACRGAIKFGDKLSRTRCISLMSSLSRCSLPFQCAHGRPSTIPLLHLTAPQLASPPKREAPPRLWKLKKRMSGSSDLG